ncbi:xanthine dehydrogenase family protein molybdopterin-binding subunit [Variovorax sp. KK3]|uniref:xanthine dehydrogenase family protein molybdopterin-binding subunit n=1 Tax=Variovorax sp. KK3 TaxID=1855728 RepID=UPI00097C9872|nr:xanthine dehydrogenase family protein molybdopterin-binding subunit [Variovorax sp. KK3]
MSIIQEAVTAVMKKAIAVAPDAWMPGGEPDPLIARNDELIGAPVSRLDGPLKVQGQARFAAEFPMDGMVYAALVYSTVPRGRIATLDTRDAQAAPGVVLVMSHENAPKMKPMPLFLSKDKAAGGDDLPVMQDDQVHWNGQPIALVLAETQAQADHAKSLIHVAYDAEPATVSFSAAKAKGTTPGTFQGEPLKLEIGDAEAALAAAPQRVDATYTTPRHNHNAIELHAATIAWKGDELVIHDASQGVAHMAWSMAQIFDIDEKQVHVTSPFVGGGFGSKTLWRHHVLAAAASKLAGRPVRMMLSREGVYRVVGGRTNTEQRVALGAQPDGTFDALIHTGVVAMTAHNNLPEPFILPAKSAYAARNFKLDVEFATIDMLANTFMRAPGEAVGTFALESAIDELAHQMKMDPIELRLRNEPEKDPTTGLPFSARHIAEAYRDGAARFGWSRRNATPGTVRDGEWLVGMGCATATYPYYRMPGGAARLTLTRDGQVKVEVAAHEMGMGTATVQTQVTAARLGLPMEQVRFCHGDSRFPGVILAGGSQQSAAIGSAVMAVQQALVTELLKLAGKDSPLHGLKPDDVVGRDGGLGKVDEPDRFESYPAILARAGRDEVTVEASAPPPLELQHWSMHSHGAMFCEVRVNEVTGETRVSRFLGSFDCGRILNAKTAASQFRGGIIMGLGLALMEETQFDERNGRIMNPSLSEYHVPVHMDVPQIDVMWTDIPDPRTPMGARGVGEIGITGVGAAVANAVFNACGKRIRDLPITLDKLMG